MLEASSSPHKRPVTCAREFNSAQHPNEAFVGTSRRSNQTVPAAQGFFSCRPFQRRRRQPAHFERNFQFCGCVVKRRIGCKMRMIGGLEVTHDSNANGCSHSFPLEINPTAHFQDRTQRERKQLGTWLNTLIQSHFGSVGYGEMLTRRRLRDSLTVERSRHRVSAILTRFRPARPTEDSSIGADAY